MKHTCKKTKRILFFLIIDIPLNPAPSSLLAVGVAK